MKLSILFVPILIAAFTSCDTMRSSGEFDNRDVRPEIMEMAEAIIKDGFIGTPGIARNPEISKEYTLRMAFIDAATIDELVHFLDHPAGILRAVAFEGLAIKGYPQLKQALLDLSQGDHYIRYIQGDIEFTMPAIEYAYTVVLGRIVPGEQPGYMNDDPKAEVDLTAAEEAFITNRILAIRSLIP